MWVLWQVPKGGLQCRPLGLSKQGYAICCRKLCFVAYAAPGRPWYSLRTSSWTSSDPVARTAQHELDALKSPSYKVRWAQQQSIVRENQYTGACAWAGAEGKKERQERWLKTPGSPCYYTDWHVFLSSHLWPHGGFLWPANRKKNPSLVHRQISLAKLVTKGRAYLW